jgi:glycosyltransferase involved in cell wall biosynthesis
MRIAIDCRVLLEPYESGVTVYTKALIREFLMHAGSDSSLELDLFYMSRKRAPWIHELFPEVRHIPLSNSIFHLRCLMTLWGKGRFPFISENFFEKKPDLIWLPDRRPFYEQMSEGGQRIKTVMTVHDFVPRFCQDSLSKKSKLWHRVFSFERLLGFCDGLIFPTKSVEQTFLNELRGGLSGGEKDGDIKSLVSYEGCELLESEKRPEALKSDVKDFHLMIAPNDPRKRLRWLMKLAKNFPAEDFVVLGFREKESRFSESEFVKLAGAKSTLRNVYFLGQLSHEEKNWCLSHAQSLLALSEYEGFDLPLLEARAHNLAALMSDIPVHRELYEGSFVVNYFELEKAFKKSLKEGFVLHQVKKDLKSDLSWTAAKEKMLLFFRGIIHDKDGKRSGDRNGNDSTENS